MDSPSDIPAIYEPIPELNYPIYSSLSYNIMFAREELPVFMPCFFSFLFPKCRKRNYT